ncbi:MAG: flavodoxin-dependent (E)-4-hydroxy-3-methylbut-2-enyl-diphosphate synthase [Candidatus Omnitrophica bacterium]|nr:flavodoxin-dependent (E)-4-hydroxy-3-methylbut-2-enyl-diphosphate synthase [Candidatus Omnitrophota bacterium]
MSIKSSMDIFKSNIKRRSARVVRIGKLYIGGKYPIAIQSMTKTITKNIDQTIEQIQRLTRAGAEIVRVAVNDHKDAQALSEIKRQIDIPLVADIHFDWTLAIEAIEAGVDKIRLNPGNIFRKAEIREICAAAKLAGIPIRVGLNSGSIGKTKNRGYALVQKAKEYLKIIEGFGFRNLVVSVKAENIFETVAAYQQIAEICDYPLHLGVTATGTYQKGLAKSYVAMGILLFQGIGDTLRISLTEQPEKEIEAARALLEAMGLRRFSPQIISCPTCGRSRVPLIKMVKRLEQQLKEQKLSKNALSSTVAMMGCVVNGPGEASCADIGLAFGKTQGLLFKKGKPLYKVLAKDAVFSLIRELTRL